MKEWDWEKNEVEKLNPNKLTYGSNKKANWKCKKGHKWKTRISDRTIKESQCPYCINKKACKDNNLAKICPHLITEWNWEKNKIKPTEVVAGSHKKVWWKCKEGHEWQSYVYSRLYGSSCPYCSNNKIDIKKSLLNTYPILMKEWNWKKNKIKPTEVTYGSGKKVWWICSKCNKQWKSKILTRTISKYSCPYCSNRKICKKNSLIKTHPELSKEWSNKNKLNPNEIVSGSNKKVWWKCLQCNYEWKAIIINRSKEKGTGCPKCKSSKGEKEVSKILNQLSIRYKKQYKFKDLKQKRFDFSLFKKYVRTPYAVIEYHGIQHYEPVSFSNNLDPQQCLINNKKNDNIKKQFCIDNDIKYLEIPYTKYNNIKKIITNFLEKNKCKG